MTQPKKMRAASTKKDDFVSVAQRLECDEDKLTFETKLGKIAKVRTRPKRRRTKRKKAAD